MEEILKCDICNNKFNLENRKPLTAKCGHTYCKHCILSNKGENDSSCPICPNPYFLSIETCISNIKLEEIIKFVFRIPDKQIIYSKPDMHRRKSPDTKSIHFSKEITKTAYRSNTMTKYPSDFRFSKKEAYSLSKNPSGVMTSFQINKMKEMDKIDHHQMLYNNLVNVRLNQFDIDEEKNQQNISETIETIPINDDNNQSFSDEFKELLKRESRDINTNCNSNSNGINGNANNIMDISSKSSIEEEKKEEEDDIDIANDNDINYKKEEQKKLETKVAAIPAKRNSANKEEGFDKLMEDLDKLFPQDGYMNASKKKKYEEQIKKAIENDKFKNDYDTLELKIFPNGDFFVGYLDNNSEKITNGILYGNNGDYYEGEFINDKKEGYGILIYKNGTRYEGVLKNNKHNGYGKLIQLDGEVFIGEWKDGKINGNGVRYHSNGDRYIGCYINNIRNGNGHYIFTNGDSYEGNWSNGKANGKGKFTFKNGNVYEGEFVDNVICGKGLFTMSNGDIFTGIFKNGLINGRGTLKTKKGERYQGEFLNGKKHGSGKIFNADGTLLCAGQWNFDKFIGKKQMNEYI